MSAYMSAVLACAAVTALANILTPADGATSKYIKYISGLVSLSVIMTPLLTALRSPVPFPEISGDVSGDMSSYEYDIDAVIIAEAERTLSETIKNDLSKTFRIRSEDIAVTVGLDRADHGDIRIESVTITLTGYGSWADTASIAEHIKDNFEKDAKVEIRYE